MLQDLLQKQVDCFGPECDEWLDAAANARLVKDAEAYYRDHVPRLRGELEPARHAHVRHAEHDPRRQGAERRRRSCGRTTATSATPRFTDMGMNRGELNIGQLVKEKWDARARLIGFGTHTGTVAAADDWDEPMKVKRVRPSLPESHERMAHDSDVGRFLLDLREGEVGRELREALREPRLERFIGVIYRPETERWSHYSEAILPKQFDAYVWFDETKRRDSAAGRAGPGYRRALVILPALRPR